jgi:hypothetical protein
MKGNEMNYKLMLELVRMRLKEIDQISLEEDSYNNEWRELSAMEDNLIRLIKITKERA